MRQRRLRRPVDDELAPVRAVHLLDRLAHLALHAIESGVHPLHLVFQRKHPLDAGQVEAHLGRQALNRPQPLEIGFGIQARISARALRPYQALGFVDAQRLRMHPD
jgi:hypothetical protein